MRRELKPNNQRPLNKHTDIQQEPRRVPARLEGVVKNTGVRPKKKQPKQKN